MTVLLYGMDGPVLRLPYPCRSGSAQQARRTVPRWAGRPMIVYFFYGKVTASRVCDRTVTSLSDFPRCAVNAL